jgi:peptidoglycan/LPS O-acetylase OafA/YrhL
MARVAAAVDANPDGGTAIARYPALDGIRGFALLLMLGMHFGFYPSFYSKAPSSIVTFLMAKSLAAGWTGLDIFFVLSGFLITSILLVSKDQPRYFRNFYGRRAVRIFPLYYTVLVVGLFVAPALFGERWDRFVGTTWSQQAWLWTYSLNIAVSLGIFVDTGMFGPLWSLALEEQYYLVWPLVVKYTSRAMLGRVCGLFIFGALAFRLAWMAAGFGWPGAYHFTLSRVDALAVGSGIALLVQDAAWRRRLQRMAPIGLMLGIAAIAVMFVRYPLVVPTEWFVVTFGHSIMALTFGCLVIIALRDPAPKWMCAPWLMNLGKWSYSIYVWHWFVRQIMAVLYAKYPATTPAGGGAAAIAFLLVGLAISTACGWASHVLIERPFLKLKRLFRYERRGGIPAVAAESEVGGMDVVALDRTPGVPVA